MIRRTLLAVAAVVAFPFFPAAPAQPTAAQVNYTITTDHISVRMIGNKGSPVILVPGLASPRTVWDGIAPELAKTHRVYLVQINGFGGDDPRGNLKPGVLAGAVEDIHALVADLKLGRVTLIGHSLGGLAGLLLAKAHPGDLAKLMVVDALPFYGVLIAPNATVAAIQPQAAAIREQLVGSYGKPANEAGIAANAAALALKPESRAKLAGWTRASDSRVAGLALYDDLTTDLRPDMAGITTPITLVYPWSVALPQAKADAFYRGEYARAPNVTFVPVADSAHFVMLDQPAAFAQAVRDFLAK